jgi:octaprenyl-diphosphate synthase
MILGASNEDARPRAESPKTSSPAQQVLLRLRARSQDMTQTTEAALGGLAPCASISAVDRGLAARLIEARALLTDDLSWVEQALVQTSAEGPSPGRDASRPLVGLGGKRVRPMTRLLSSAWFGEVPDASRHLAVSVELIHSATLLHDDVIDEGTERRGESSARMVWGNAVSVLGGDLMLTHALVTAQQHAPELMGPLLATLRHLVNGEIVQLRGRSQIEVSEEIYSSILRDKTAALFRFAARAGAQLAGATERHQSLLADFGECLGMAFQLIDDLLDYTGTATGKTMFADLAQAS